MLFKLTWNLR